MNIQKALAHLGFKPEDYTISGDDFSMTPKFQEQAVDIDGNIVMEQVDVTPAKPSQEQLIAADQEVQLSECDVSMLINAYLEGKERDPENDCLNIVNGRIYSWNFTHVPQPSISELLAFKSSVETKASQDVINKEAEEYLKSTDFYIIREVDSGVQCPMEIKIARATARARIIR